MSIMTVFNQITAPRKDINKKHDLIDILFLTFSAVLSGALGWKDIKQFGDENLEWLRQFREFKNGIRVDDTIARVVSCLKPDEFNQCFMNWVNGVRQENNQPQIAIDRKTLRHSFTEKPIDALHSITAWHAESGLVLAQMKSSGKKNENASVLEILNALNINGAHITVDAMNTQKTIATKITKGGADYTMCVKDNHKNLKQQIAAYFYKVQRDTPNLIKTNTTVDSGHGGIETRTCEQLQANEWIEGLEDWSEVRVVIKITKR